jgi:hypothetical protein
MVFSILFLDLEKKNYKLNFLVQILWYKHMNIIENNYFNDKLRSKKMGARYYYLVLNP